MKNPTQRNSYEKRKCGSTLNLNIVIYRPRGRKIWFADMSILVLHIRVYTLWKSYPCLNPKKYFGNKKKSFFNKSFKLDEYKNSFEKETGMINWQWYKHFKAYRTRFKVEIMLKMVQYSIKQFFFIYPNNFSLPIFKSVNQVFP